MEKVDYFNLLAVLGALAWLPHLISLVSNLLTKPNLSIISHPELELGYTTFGPILNMQLAFSAENKEVLIQRIEIILKHDSNETHLLSWDWFEEQLLQMDTPDQGPMPFKKNQRAIAIKILKESLVEKKIGFQEKKFKERHYELLNATKENYNNIIQSNQDITTLKVTKPYNDLHDFFKNSFIWKVGKYSVNMKVFIAKKDKPFEHNINFQLTNLDIKTLEANIKNCQDFIENSYIFGKLDFSPQWRWVNTYKM
jgi:hypothetical protein